MPGPTLADGAAVRVGVAVGVAVGVVVTVGTTVGRLVGVAVGALVHPATRGSTANRTNARRIDMAAHSMPEGGARRENNGAREALDRSVSQTNLQCSF